MGCTTSKPSETNEKLIDITNYNRDELNNEIITNVERNLREILNNELNSVTIINEFKDVVNPNDILNKLKNSKNDNDISYKGLTNLTAKIIDIYDANICTLKFIYNNEIHQITIRMDGYSAPEKTLSKNNVKKIEKILSVSVTKKFTELCCSPTLNENDKLIKLDITNYDGNGKRNAKNIGKIYTEEHGCINDYMIENKYAYIYGGGEKKKITDLIVEGYYSHLLVPMADEGKSVSDLLETESLDISIMDEDEL